MSMRTLLSRVFRARAGPVSAAAPPEAVSAGNPDETTGLEDVLAEALRAQASGRTDHAEQIYRRILERDDAHAEAHFQLGCLYQRQGRTDKADEELEIALALKPDHADAYFQLGLANLSHKQADEAEDCFRMAVYHKPGLDEAHLRLGRLLEDRGAYADAASAYRQVIQLRSHSDLPRVDLGRVLSRLGQREQALTCFEQALHLEPTNAAAHKSIGVLLADQGNLDEAEPHLRKAVQLEPENDDCRLALAELLNELGRHEEVRAHVEALLQRDPDNRGAQLLAGSLLLRDRGPAAAIAHYRVLLEKWPDFQALARNLSLLLLANGYLEEGWKTLECRLSDTSRDFGYPVWDGASLSDRTILVYAEQGIGDEIRYASCLPDVIRQARRCVVECDPRLADIYRRSFPGALVHGRPRDGDTSWLSKVERVDVQVPIGSLPLHFRRDIAHFPARAGYLQADPERVEMWRGRVSALGPGPKVGVAWRSVKSAVRRSKHFARFEDWGRIFHVPGVHFVNLQYDDCADELLQAREAWGVEVHNWEDLDQFNDIEGVAALMSALDLVITAPTVVSHLAGALGKEVWMPSVEGHMIFLGTDHCPWFPSLRAFRQSRQGEWGPVLDRVADELQRLASRRGGRD